MYITVLSSLAPQRCSIGTTFVVAERGICFFVKLNSRSPAQQTHGFKATTRLAAARGMTVKFESINSGPDRSALLLDHDGQIPRLERKRIFGGKMATAQNVFTGSVRIRELLLFTREVQVVMQLLASSI